MWRRISAFTFALALGSMSNAATLTSVGWNWLQSQGGGGNSQDFGNVHDISVFPGSAGYAGSDETGAATSGVFGDGTVEAYSFFTANAGADGDWETGDETIVSYASGGTSITGRVSAGTAIFGTNNAADIWENTDPEGFTTSADYTNATGVSGISHLDFLTLRTAPVWSGTIDISSYSSGTIYFLYGSYRGGDGAALDLDLVMKDADLMLADIQLLDAGSNDQPNNWEQYVVEVEFVNDLGYDTIDYELAFAISGRNVPNGRIEGIVLDGVTIPEPAAFTLIGLVGLSLLRRRGLVEI